MKTWGFRDKQGQKVHPNFATNIAMEIHYGNTILSAAPSLSQRKTKGQQLKGKIVSVPFAHFLALFFHIFTLSRVFRISPPGLSLRIKGFFYCFCSKRRKENKRE